MKNYYLIGLILIISIIGISNEVIGACVDITSINNTINPYNVNSNTILCNNGTLYNNASATSGSIILNASNVVLDCNFTKIIGNNTGYGVYSQQKINITIQNCIIDSYKYGIYNFRYSNLTVDNNTISGISANAGIGIYIERANVLVASEWATIKNNFINIPEYKSVRVDGIYTTQSSLASINIYNNRIILNSTGGYGIDVIIGGSAYIQNINITNNTISLDTSTNGIVLGSNNTGCIIQNNYISGRINKTGIATQYSNNTLVRNNIINNTLETSSAEGDCISLAFTNTNNIYSNNTLVNCPRSSIRPASTDLSSLNYFYNNNIISSLGKDFMFAGGNFRVENNTFTLNKAKLSSSSYDNVTFLGNCSINYTVTNGGILISSRVDIKNFNVLNNTISLVNEGINYPFNDIKNTSTGTILASNVDTFSISLSPNQQIEIGDFGDCPVGSIFPCTIISSPPYDYYSTVNCRNAKYGTINALSELPSWIGLALLLLAVSVIIGIIITTTVDNRENGFMENLTIGDIGPLIIPVIITGIMIVLGIIILSNLC
jgi:hypothetical protein